MKYGATVPPTIGLWPTENSDTGDSYRYCVHRVSCTFYKKSKKANNTVGFETMDINEMKNKLLELPKLPGGIKACGTCLEGCINFSI